MAIEIKVPVLPESVSDATIAKWYKKQGDFVKRDEHILDIETDKVVLEVVAPSDGSIETILKREGDTVKGEEVVAQFKANASGDAAGFQTESNETKTAKVSNMQAQPAIKDAEKTSPQKSLTPEKALNAASVLSPSARRTATAARATTKSVSMQSDQSTQPSSSSNSIVTTLAIEFPTGHRVEKRVPMSRLRARVAERLLQAQQNAAILTTFNEINMKPVMDMRQKYKDIFEKTHGVRLGFMSFFTMASVEALKRFPMINASVDGTDIIYHGYYDIGIAVSSPRGLVVPIIRNAETLDMASIEKKIAEYGQKAKEGQLSMEEITGGTFTISNGGVFGSLMSTPILNPPQSAILGMHKIEERPIVENGGIVIRPMMYVAMSYDHRIIDGSESVRFLVTIKELLEDPTRFLLEI